MKYLEKYPKSVRLGIAMFSILVIFAAAFVVYKVMTHNNGSASYDQTALMAVSSRGGLCSNGPCEHRVFNVYENGDFEGHTKLTPQEIATLKQVIASTDFTAYGKNTKVTPSCASYVDGSDRVFYFPQKYGERMVIPCELEIPLDDKVFSYLNSVIKTHTPEE